MKKYGSKLGATFAIVYILLVISLIIYGFTCDGEWCVFTSFLIFLPEALLSGYFPVGKWFQYFILLSPLINAVILYSMGLCIEKIIRRYEIKKDY